MRLLNALEFVREHLDVRYRASPDPQHLTIHLRLDGTDVAVDNANVLSICNEINFGMAGSDVFTPTAGSMLHPGYAILKRGRLGPREYRFVLELAAVAPIFLRIIVEKLRAVGRDVPLRSLSITGSLPTDNDPLSINERHVVAWLDDPLAYPKRWPSLSFPFDIEDRARKGISIQIAFTQPVKAKKIRDDLEIRLLAWDTTVVGYVSPNGRFVRQQLGPTFPAYAWKKEGLGCSIELFEHARGPSVDLLLNMLERVHSKLVPLKHVLIEI